MNFQSIRWPVVVTAMAVALALFFGGGFVMKNRLVEHPLQEIYRNASQVESFAVEEGETQYTIKATFKETKSLAMAYNELDRETARVLKGAAYRLEVADHRTPQLEEKWGRMNLFVQEALVTGKFADMADRIAADAASAGLTATLEVDGAHVFLKLSDGHGGYLYSVTSRVPEAAKGPAEGGIGL